MKYQAAKRVVSSKRSSLFGFRLELKLGQKKKLTGSQGWNKQAVRTGTTGSQDWNCSRKAAGSGARWATLVGSGSVLDLQAPAGWTRVAAALPAGTSGSSLPIKAASLCFQRFYFLRWYFCLLTLTEPEVHQNISHPAHTNRAR